MEDADEKKELKDNFERAATYVRQNSGRFDSDKLLYFYGRFKQANEGACNTKKPGLFDFQGKQKWEAWKKLDDMSKENAMLEYITYLSNIDQDWEDKVNTGSTKKSGGTWVTVSTMSSVDTEIADENKSVFDWCKEGNTEQLKKMLSCDNCAINRTDDAGMTLLHWACDRGYCDLAEMLLKAKADINAKDSEGQTALHYAVCCEHKDVVQLLLLHGADKLLKDCDGISPLDLETSDEIKRILQT